MRPYFAARKCSMRDPIEILRDRAPSTLEVFFHSILDPAHGRRAPLVVLGYHFVTPVRDFRYYRT